MVFYDKEDKVLETIPISDMKIVEIAALLSSKGFEKKAQVTTEEIIHEDL